MFEKEFYNWLKNIKNFSENTIKSRISNCQRVELFEDNLDNLFKNDKCANILYKLSYSKNDEYYRKHPLHKIPINGNIYNGSSTLKQAVGLYVNFKLDNNNISLNNKIKATSKINNNPEIIIQKILLNITEKKDSYDLFLKYFNINKNEFFQFGIDNTIFTDYEKAYIQWIKLKEKLFNNKQIAIRGYGRDSHGTEMFFSFYEYVFNNKNIVKDKTNNDLPQRIISEMTNYKRNINLYNYQTSHIFGMTKNPLMFEASWNICLTPKIFDPLTGHETKGNLPTEYSIILRKFAKEKYERIIDEYNEIIDKYSNKINLFIDNLNKNKENIQFIKDIKLQISKINII